MANWFSSLFSSAQPVMDFSVLKVDMHSHLVPGIDDGAATLDDAIEYVLAMKAMGFKKIITTPHIMPGYYDNTAAIISEGLEKVKAELIVRGIDMPIECAAEYYFDDYLFDLLEKKELMTFGDNYVLFELSTVNMPPRVKDFIFQCNMNGIKPLLAHVERYSFLHDNIRLYEELHDMDLFMQVNIGSIVGAYGEKLQKVSHKVIEHGIIEFLATDLHGPRHIEHLQKAMKDKYVQKVLKGKTFMNNQL